MKIEISVEDFVDDDAGKEMRRYLKSLRAEVFPEDERALFFCLHDEAVDENINSIDRLWAAKYNLGKALIEAASLEHHAAQLIPFLERAIIRAKKTVAEIPPDA